MQPWAPPAPSSLLTDPCNLTPTNSKRRASAPGTLLTGLSYVSDCVLDGLGLFSAASVDISCCYACKPSSEIQAAGRASPARLVKPKALSRIKSFERLAP